MPRKTSLTGSELFIVDNSDEEWKAARYLRDWCQLGGYQVCEKWLKDRKGRTLSQDDITHYQKIVVALSETIRLMAEVDRVIVKHGGWPAAFQTVARA